MSDLQQRINQISKSKRLPADQVKLTVVPPADKAGHLQWLFNEARRDHQAVQIRRRVQAVIAARKALEAAD